ncbi:hypothetical protein ACIRYZ_05150 [Kitasatospora sp. NPDC101155]
MSASAQPVALILIPAAAVAAPLLTDRLPRRIAVPPYRPSCSRSCSVP